MIVTLTPNPSFDRTFDVDVLQPGRVHRARSERLEPGGKGINVAHAIRKGGRPVRAVVPLGGFEGRQFAALLEQLDLDVVPVAVEGPVRSNVSLVEPDGAVTKINAPGSPLGASQAEELISTTLAAGRDASWIAGCGSLPPGVGDDFFAGLVTRAHEQGVRVAIDTSGAPLRAVIDAGPDLIKPNSWELAETTGRRLRTLGDVVDAAVALRNRGVVSVVVSLGADGAVLIEADGAWHATTPPIVVRNAVGAGDSLVAGLLLGDATGPDALRLGVAYGAAAAQLPGTQLPEPDDLDIDVVEVHSIDPDRPLADHGGT